MIIRGVFSMSIIDNLKSLFKRGKDNEEKGIDDQCKPLEFQDV